MDWKYNATNLYVLVTPTQIKNVIYDYDLQRSKIDGRHDGRHLCSCQLLKWSSYNAGRNNRVSVHISFAPI